MCLGTLCFAVSQQCSLPEFSKQMSLEKGCLLQIESRILFYGRYISHLHVPHKSAIK